LPLNYKPERVDITIYFYMLQNIFRNCSTRIKGQFWVI